MSMKLTSDIWNHFTKPTKEKKAKCKYCKVCFAMQEKSSSNLSRHLKLKHPAVKFSPLKIFSRNLYPEKDSEIKENEVVNRPKNIGKNAIWKHFTIIVEKKIGTCNYCKEVLSFNGNVSNFRRHLQYQHPMIPSLSAAEVNEIKLMKQRTSGIWEHFTTPNKFKGKARCKYCKKIFNFAQGSNLVGHLKLKHPAIQFPSSKENHSRLLWTESKMIESQFLDSSLALRIRKYMEDNKRVNIEDMAEYFMNSFKEFKDKRKKPFTKNVREVYQRELKNKKSVNSRNAVDDTDTDGESSPDADEISTNNEIRKKRKLNLRTSYSFANKNSSLAANDLINLKSSKHQGYSQFIKNLRRKILDDSRTRTSKAKIIDAKELIPKCTLSDFIGKESVLGIEMLNKYLAEDQRLHFPRTLHISGSKRSGKSMLVKCLAGHLRYPLYRISESELSGETEGDIKELLSQIMKEALSNAPCVLHIDKLDDISSSKKFGITKNTESKVIEQLKQLVKDFTITHSTNQVLLIVESRSPVIDPDLHSLIVLEIKIPFPNKEAKVLLLKEFFIEKGWLSSDVNLEDIAEQATSFVAGDFKVLMKKAAIHAGFREMSEMAQNMFPNHIYFKQTDLPDIQIKMNDILTVLPTIKPTLKEEGFIHTSNVKWEDVEGLEDIKKIIYRKIINPIKDKEVFSNFGINKPNVILLYGPPGCGKTLLGEAVANAAGINLLSVKGPELFSTDQSESERNVREIFRRAESAAPCLIFFEEFDYLCPKRTGKVDNESSKAYNIVDTLIAEMDDLDEKREVYVIATTNRPEFIDPSILRSDRIGTRLFVGLPDDNGRVDIFRSCAKKQKVQLDSDVDFEEIASWCENFSGADCSSLLKVACEEAILEIQSMYKEGKLELEDVKVTKEHFETALTIVGQSVNTEVHKEYLVMKERFEKSFK